VSFLAACLAQQSKLVMLTHEQCVRMIGDNPALSVNVLLKIVTMMSRRLRETSGPLVNYLQD
jgi:hypothetical protein